MKKKFSLPAPQRTFSSAADSSSIVLNLEIKLPSTMHHPNPAPVAPPMANIPADVIKQRLRDKAKELAPLNKHSSVAKFNQDIYPKPVTETPSESPKGMAAKPRPGYYH